jgi:hypothetical protein
MAPVICSATDEFSAVREDPRLATASMGEQGVLGQDSPRPTRSRVHRPDHDRPDAEPEHSSPAPVRATDSGAG